MCPRKKSLSDDWRASRTRSTVQLFFIDNQSRSTVQLFFLDQRFEVRFRGKILINCYYCIREHLTFVIAFKNAKVSCPAIHQTLTCLCDSNIFKKESALGRSCRPKSSPDFNYFHTYLYPSPLNYASNKNNPSDIGSKWYIF